MTIASLAPILPVLDKIDIERFWSKVPRQNQYCWDWQGTIANDGYGVFHLNRLVAGKRMVRAHRVMYALINGELDPNLTIDHTCRNKKCVNPQHIRAATVKENTLACEYAPATVNAKKSHCKRGHPLSGNNLVLQKSRGRLQRTCKVCNCLKQKRYLQRKKEAMLARH